MQSDVPFARRLSGDPARVALALVWALLLFVAFQPGLMSADSLTHLYEGLEDAYTNWQTPIVSMLIGKAHAWLGSPWPVLALQLLGLGLGLVSLLWGLRGREGFAASGLLALFLALPPVWAVGVALWKDVLLGVTLLWAVVLLSRERPGWAFAFLVLATLMRHNAIAATALLVPAVVARVPSLARHRGPAVAAAVALMALAPGAFERALGARKLWIGGSLLVFDVAGIYAREPALLEGSALAAAWGWDRDTLGYVYNPRSLDLLLWGDPARGSVSPATVMATREMLTAEWRRLVLERPGLYLQHRLEAYAALLGVGGSDYPFHRVIDPNPLGLQLRTKTLVHRALVAVREASAGAFFFRGGFWLLMALAMTAVGWHRRHTHGTLMFWVAASGASYLLAYLPVSVSPDFRFVYWTLLSVFAAGALWLRTPRARSAP